MQATTLPMQIAVGIEQKRPELIRAYSKQLQATCGESAQEKAAAAEITALVNAIAMLVDQALVSATRERELRHVVCDSAQQLDKHASAFYRKLRKFADPDDCHGAQHAEQAGVQLGGSQQRGGRETRPGGLVGLW